MSAPILRRMSHALVRAREFAAGRSGRASFDCPACRYRGPLRQSAPSTGPRRDTQCPACGALERHRLQELVSEREFGGRDTFFRRRSAGMYDVVDASHVLEHVRDDASALSEIRGVPTPSPSEAMHVRPPGLDYFGRCRAIFPLVDVFLSTGYPRADSPHRTPMAGTAHADFVPICRT